MRKTNEYVPATSSSTVGCVARGTAASRRGSCCWDRGRGGFFGCGCGARTICCCCDFFSCKRSRGLCCFRSSWCFRSSKNCGCMIRHGRCTRDRSDSGRFSCGDDHFSRCWYNNSCLCGDQKRSCRRFGRGLRRELGGRCRHLKLCRCPVGFGRGHHICRRLNLRRNIEKADGSRR